MQVNECYKQVAQLGFEESLDSDERFVYTLNRALLQVASLRPATRVCYIEHNPLPNALGETGHELNRRCGATTYESGSAVKAYYFEAHGAYGLSCVFEKRTETGWDQFLAVPITPTEKVYRGLLKDGGDFVDAPVRMTFYSPYLYHMKNVALYEQVYSDDADDVPSYEAYTGYNVEDMANDFLSLASPPVEAPLFYTANRDLYDIENGRILLIKRKACGRYKVRYNHRPAKVIYRNNLVEDDTVLDLDEDLCNLLPNLIASYLLAENDAELAQYYDLFYREAAQDIMAKSRNTRPARVKNVTGWC